MRSADLAGLLDEDVFLPTDSDCDSSRTQSPRELDLLPASPRSPGAGPGPFLRRGPPSSLRGPAPDVLRTSEPPPADGDAAPPSRQIQLLRITESRRGLCVRTGSLELPPSPRPRAEQRLPPHPPPARSLSEDSGSRLATAAAARGNRYTTLKVYPQYRTGLSTETSVKVRAPGTFRPNASHAREVHKYLDADTVLRGCSSCEILSVSSESACTSISRALYVNYSPLKLCHCSNT